MSARATGRHRAEAAVSTPLTTMTAAIATKVPSASAARSGFVIAVSSGLVAGVGLPAQAADATGEGATTTASLKLPAFAPAADQVVVDQAVSAPATAKVTFDGSTMSASLRNGAPATDSTAKAAEGLARVSRSLVRAAYGEQVAAQRRAERARAMLAARTTHRVSRDSQRTSPTPRSAPVSHSNTRDAVIALAAQLLGTPYRYGGTSRGGLDCSGYTQYIFRQIGVNLPRTAQQQFNFGRRVSRSQAQKGDLVAFFGGGGVYHIAIYDGEGGIYAETHTGSVAKHERSIYSANVAFVNVLG